MPLQDKDNYNLTIEYLRLKSKENQIIHSSMSNTFDKISDFKNVKIFQGLNELRFIAAFFVVLHHSETIKRKNGLPNLEWLGLFRNGANAVTLFFVLSGFLITYLLLKESDKTNTISIHKFYLKRILRIWPLYFLLVLIGTLGLGFILPLFDISYEMPYGLNQTWFYFLFFLPGLVTFFYGHHLLEPLWSIGVEEVFYLIWAPLFKYFKKKILKLLFSLIAIKIILNFIAIYLTSNELFNYCVNTFQIESMAIGGIGAYLLYTRGSSFTNNFIFKVPFQIIAVVVLFTMIVFHSNINNIYWDVFFKTPILSKLFVDFLFLYLILNVSCVEQSILKLRSKPLAFLGEISYGIYMYHMLAIFATIAFLKNYLSSINSISCFIIFLGVTTLITLMVSLFSKYFFENYFLRIKTKLENRKSEL
jgi:peptidoglycan/LPS O-acetylase OafA/YrhL